jgi:hypothetical protein
LGFINEIRICEIEFYVDDGIPDMGLPGFCVLVGNARPVLIVVADDLIPGDRLVEPGGLIRFLIIDGVGSGMSARAGGNDLAVKDIDEPSQFVILVVERMIGE